MHYIQGTSRDQAVLFPEVLDDYIAEENPIRFIDAFVDKLDLVALGFEQSTLNITGRPPYHPSILLKLYIYGYLNRIRSSRRLENECHRNVELMWLLGKLQPDHKTISEFRRRHVKSLKAVCRKFTMLCKQLDLFGGEFISIDGSKFKAVNGRDNNYTKAGLEKLLSEIDDRINTYFQSLDETDNQEQDVHKTDARELKEKIASLNQVKQCYEALLEQLAESGENQISLTDPDSRLMKTGNTGKDVCYNAQIAVDDKHNLIVADDVSNVGSDRIQLSNMAKAAQSTLDVEDLDAAADKGYHSTEEIKECVQSGITPYIPRPEQSFNKSRGLFGKPDFSFDSELNCYTCPAGEKLGYRTTITQAGQRYHTYATSACRRCEIRHLCTDNKQKGRRIFRLADEHLLEEMQQRLSQRPEAMKKRRCMVEHPFGTLKRSMGYHYFLLQGLEKVKMEFSLSVMAYNLKRAINILGVRNLIEGLQAA